MDDKDRPGRGIRERVRPARPSARIARQPISEGRPVTPITSATSTTLSPRSTDSLVPIRPIPRRREPLRREPRKASIEEVETNYTTDSLTPDLSDPMITGSILKQSLADVQGFTVLTLDSYMQQKERVKQITEYLDGIKNKMRMELKVKEAIMDVVRVGDEEKRRLTRVEGKIKDLDKETWLVVGDLRNAENGVLKHLAASLSWKVNEINQMMSNAPTLKVKRTDDRLLVSAEERIKELEARVTVLQSSISNRSSRSGEKLGVQPTSLEFNRLKLDYATTKAALVDIREELKVSKDSQQKLIRNSDEALENIQAKDRQIANLLSELEETTNKLQMTPSRRNMDSTREMKGIEKERDDLKLKLEELQLSPPQRRSRNQISATDQQKLSKLQILVDETVGNPKSAFTVSRLTEKVTAILQTIVELGKKEETLLEDLRGSNSDLDVLKNDMAKLKQRHEQDIGDMERRAKKEIRNEIEIGLREETVQSRQKEEKLAKSMQLDLEVQMTEYKLTFQKEQVEAKVLLEIAEQALVDAKKQFFSEREKLQEKIDEEQNEVEKGISSHKRAIEDLNQENDSLTRKVADLMEKVQELERKLVDSKEDLELKSREIDLLKAAHSEEKVGIVKNEEEIRAISNELERSLKVSEQAIVDLKADIEKLNQDSKAARLQYLANIEQSEGALFDASDKLERTQRLLQDVNGDVAKYRAIAEDRDQETLLLKRQLRSKEKELTEGVMAGTSDSTRRLVDQKDRDIELSKAEIRSLQLEISSLKRKLEVQTRDMDEAKSQMRRAARGDKTEQSDEIARLQILLLELKTKQAELLEKADDAEHEVQTLQLELKNLKNRNDMN